MSSSCVLALRSPDRSKLTLLYCRRLRQLDEPIGVGFSYAENGQVVGRTEQAALDVQAFIAIFIETFKEFKNRPLHLVGSGRDAVRRGHRH